MLAIRNELPTKTVDRPPRLPDNLQMSRILLRLRGVPVDELNDIVGLLEQQDVEFYETSAGNWGISLPALWIKNEEDYPRAREMLDSYQAERQQQARSEWKRQREEGTQPTLRQIFTEKPWSTLGLIGFCAAIAWFSIRPFLSMLE